MLIIISGALSAQVLYYYFQCFSRDGDSTVIASWLATTPVFVYVAGFILFLFDIFSELSLFSPNIIAAVATTSLALAALEYVSVKAENRGRTYFKYLSLMMLCNIAYILIIDQSLAHATATFHIPEDVIVVALLPLYWLGFASGMRFLLPKQERQRFMQNKLIRQYLIPIIIVEVLGMFVFFFEFMSLGSVDPVTTAIIISLHVIPVWCVSVFLNMKARSYTTNTTTAHVFGLPISTSTLAEFSLNTKTLPVQLILIGYILIGLYLFFTA